MEGQSIQQLIDHIVFNNGADSKTWGLLKEEAEIV